MDTITKNQTQTTARLRSLGYDARNAFDGTRVQIRPTLVMFVVVNDGAYRGETHDHGVVSHFMGWNFTRLRDYLSRVSAN